MKRRLCESGKNNPLMDESHYRQTYQQINRQRCVFEKTILTRQSACSQSHRFCLADREGVACNHDLAHKRCSALLASLRRNANFALGIPKVDTALPHNKEIRIQHGGLLGIQQTLAKDCSQTLEVDDIYSLMTSSIETYESLESLPFDEIVKYIVRYEIKKRRRSS